MAKRNTPSQIAVEAEKEWFDTDHQDVPARSLAGYIQSAIDKAMSIKQTEIDMLRGMDCLVYGDGPCGCCIKCLRQRSEKAELQIMQLREALAMALNDSVSGQLRPLTKNIIDEALSASAVIAGKWVPVEDVRPMIESFDASGFCHAREVFLAKHADKLKPA